MSRELTRNERRLGMLALTGLFWGAFLVAIGFTIASVAIVLGLLLMAAAVALQGRAIAAPFMPRARVAAGWTAARWRASDAALHRVADATAARVGRVDWAGKRDAAAGRAAAARRTAAAGSRRALAAGSAAVSTVGSRAQELRGGLAERQRPQPPKLGRGDAMRLNEQAAALRQDGRLDEALELGEQALAIFRTLGDPRGKALTLNGLGLTQARLGDEPGALDSYETAVALLSELGDSHGAGRVLANVGALHRGQGHDAQARAAWSDALERLEPGTVEHDRTAEQLRLAS